MKRVAASLFLAILVGGASGVIAQTTIEEARQQGNAMGKAMRADDTLGPNELKLQELPGYGGTDLPEKGYFDDPDKLTMDGKVAAPTSDAYGTVTDKGGTRPSFSNAEILAATSRGTAIEKDPETYLGAAKLLGLKPEQVMMVAAHNYDLIAARSLGLKTAFVPRVTEYGPHQKEDFEATSDWDFVVADIEDLAGRLGC